MNAADRLEEMIADRPPILEVFTTIGNLKIDHQMTDEQKELLRNVAALVRACEAMDIASDKMDLEYCYYQIENEHAAMKSALDKLEESE